MPQIKTLLDKVSSLEKGSIGTKVVSELIKSTTKTGAKAPTKENKLTDWDLAFEIGNTLGIMLTHGEKSYSSVGFAIGNVELFRNTLHMLPQSTLSRTELQYFFEKIGFAILYHLPLEGKGPRMDAALDTLGCIREVLTSARNLHVEVTDLEAIVYYMDLKCLKELQQLVQAGFGFLEPLGTKGTLSDKNQSLNNFCSTWKNALEMLNRIQTKKHLEKSFRDFLKSSITYCKKNFGSSSIFQPVIDDFERML